MSTKCLRWGIVSAGKICHDFVCGIKVLPPSEHQVVAVAARNIDDAKKFAFEHGIAKSYGSYAEIANDTELGKSLDLLTINQLKVCFDR